MPSWAGGWDNMFGQPHSLLNQYNATDRGVARLTASQGGMKFGELAGALTESGVGGATLLEYTQVKAQQADGLNLGGKVPVQNYQLVPPRTLTVADKNYVQDQLWPAFAPATYPPDKSGNGGGGKAGTIN